MMASSRPTLVEAVATLARSASALLSLTIPSLAGAQQVPDSAFRPPVPRPAFAAARGPTLCLDEAHRNFHTLDNRFFAFGELARRDGFRVSPSRAPFSRDALGSCKVMVISNAEGGNGEWNTYPSPTPSAFTTQEIAAVRAWVEQGNALLLIADHMPLAGAASQLAAAFGVSFTDGFAVKQFATEAGRDSSFATPTLFRDSDGTLAAHPIVRGRDSTERVTRVRSFTGQAFRATAKDVAPVMVLPPDFVSLEPRYAW